MFDKGVEVDPRKTEAVKNYPISFTPIDNCSFLGFSGYYCMLLEVFCSTSTPLTFWTKKKIKFEWAKTCEKSFNELKDKLTLAPVLTLIKCF